MAPPPGLRLVTPPSSVSFRPAALRTSFVTGSGEFLELVSCALSERSRWCCYSCGYGELNECITVTIEIFIFELRSSRFPNFIGVKNW
jgi:hypothetical protein